MRDGSRIWIGIALSMAIIAIDVILLCISIIELPWFLAIIVLAMVVMFVPMLILNGDWIVLTDKGIVISAPMANIDIPFSSIRAVDCIEGFKPGIRTFGYSGLRRGSGSFSNETLGSYTYVGDSRIDLMIVVRYLDRKEKYVAFNLKDIETTTSLYDTIRDRTGVGSDVHGIPEMNNKGQGIYRSTKRVMYSITVAILLACAAIVAFGMTMGHVDVSMDEDSLHIDATMMREDIPFEDITYMELRENMDYGARVSGLGNSNYLSGNFSNDEFGKYRLAVHKDVQNCIVVQTTDMVCVFNLQSYEDTKTFFEELTFKTSNCNMSVDVLALSECAVI